MSRIRITKIFDFEMAHALYGYDGPCKNIHGHSYRLYVTVTGEPEIRNENPKYGMVIDFSLLKEIVHKTIVNEFDHALVLNANSPHKELADNPHALGKVFLVPYQPTCENMVADFAEKIRKKLPWNIQLHNLRLQETLTSFAEWFAEDNR